MIIETISELQQNYLKYLKSSNSAINPQAVNTYWNIQAGAMASILLDLYYSLQLVENSIFVQNAVGDQVDLWLYSRGLPARQEPTYGTVVVTISTAGAYPIIIPINTKFTAAPSGNIYQNLVALSIPDDTTQFTLYATSLGTGYIEGVGTTFTSSIIALVSLIANINGTIQETDQACITRTLQSIRSPIGGARETDYQVYVLQSNSQFSIPIITDSIIIPNFYQLTTIIPPSTTLHLNTLGIAPLTGQPITENQLNQGLATGIFTPFSRQIGTDNITIINTYMQNLRLVGLTINIPAVATWNLNKILTIKVTLVAAYTLTSLITVTSQDSDNNPIQITLTIAELIMREARRCVCNQPFGGTVTSDPTINIIPIDSISFALNQQLGVNNGALAQLLTNVQIEYDGSIQDIEVPLFNASGIGFNFPSTVPLQYDIGSYTTANIVIGNIT